MKKLFYSPCLAEYFERTWRIERNGILNQSRPLSTQRNAGNTHVFLRNEQNEKSTNTGWTSSTSRVPASNAKDPPRSMLQRRFQRPTFANPLQCNAGKQIGDVESWFTRDAPRSVIVNQLIVNGRHRLCVGLWTFPALETVTPPPKLTTRLRGWINDKSLKINCQIEFQGIYNRSIGIIISPPSCIISDISTLDFPRKIDSRESLVSHILAERCLSYSSGLFLNHFACQSFQSVRNVHLRRLRMRRSIRGNEPWHLYFEICYFKKAPLSLRVVRERYHSAIDS